MKQYICDACKKRCYTVYIIRSMTDKYGDYIKPPCKDFCKGCLIQVIKYSTK